MAIEDGKVLITGGAGHVGSALVWALNQRGFDNILITDKQLDVANKFKNLVPLKFDDYMEADQFMQVLPEDPSLFEDIKTVFHLGAYTSDQNHTAKEFIENNYEYSKVMCSWALGNGARFIYASAGDTYGQIEHRSEDPDCLHQLRPDSMYAYSKHLFDLNAQRHGILDYMLGLKYFHLFGPNESHKTDKSSIINRHFEAITSASGSDFTKAELSDEEINLLYIKDAVEMTLFLAENPNAKGLFNIASDSSYKKSALLKLSSALINKAQTPPALTEIAARKDSPTKINKLLSLGYKKESQAIANSLNEYINRYLIPNKTLGDES